MLPVQADKKPGRAGSAQLQAFWGTVVEGELFASSLERKYLGFELFTSLLPHLGYGITAPSLVDLRQSIHCCYSLAWQGLC